MSRVYTLQSGQTVVKGAEPSKRTVQEAYHYVSPLLSDSITPEPALKGEENRSWRRQVALVISDAIRDVTLQTQITY